MDKMNLDYSENQSYESQIKSSNKSWIGEKLWQAQILNGILDSDFQVC